MASVMSDVSSKMSDTFDNVRHMFRPKRRKTMLEERWPLLVLGAVLVAGLATGIAFAIVQRRNSDMDMNTQLDELLVAETFEPTI